MYNRRYKKRKNMPRECGSKEKVKNGYNRDIYVKNRENYDT